MHILRYDAEAWGDVEREGLVAVAKNEWRGIVAGAILPLSIWTP